MQNVKTMMKSMQKKYFIGSLIGVLLISTGIVSISLTHKVSGDRKDIDHKVNETDIYLYGDNIIVKFEGKTPHAKFFKTEYNESEKTPWYKIMFKSLVEKDPDGDHQTSNAYNGLESISWTHEVVKETITGGERIRVTFSASFQVGSAENETEVIFHFYLFGFDYEVEITGTGTTTTTPVQVQAQAAEEIKFDVEIYDWPFLDPANTLELDVRLISIHRVILTQVESDEQVSTTEAIENYEGGEVDGNEDRSYLVLPSTAIADGEEVEVIRTHKKTTVGGAQDHMFILFPSFKESLLYDPVIGIGIPTKTSYLLVTIVVVALVIVGAFIIRSKKRS
jgi:hypothetical protein